MALNIPALIAIVVFYVLILVVGIYAGRKTTKSTNSDELFLANRSLGLFVTTFTCAATMVGGAYINGTAEVMAWQGFIWTQTPIGYNLAMVFAGVFYVPCMRREGYVTVFDPMQKRFGNRMGGLLFIPEFFGDLFWEAAILAALGSTLSIIVNLDYAVAIIVSTCVAVVYTFLGGLYSVAYTDVVQFFLIMIGLIIPLPFILTNSAVDFTKISDTWIGSLPTNQIGQFVDTYLLLIAGGIPWQAFYQRALACQTTHMAVTAAVLGTGLSVLAAIPPAVIGVAGASVDWNQTAYGAEGVIPIPDDMKAYVLPMVLQYICPVSVAAFGIGAVSAAAMSSCDSIFLASGSILARNIYQNIFRPKASEMEIVWVLRISIVIVGALGTVIAITVKSVYGLLVLCGDLMYVIQFPHLTCVLWIKFVNTYGSVTGFVVGLFLRVAGGEIIIHMPPLIKYPFYDEHLGQLFPFKTFAMTCCFLSIVVVSYVTDRLFRRKILPIQFDFFKCFGPLDEPPDKSSMGKADVRFEETTQF